MMSKHFLLGVAVAAMLPSLPSAILVLGQLPDTATPVQVLIHSDLASKLGFTPVEAQNEFDVKSLIDELTGAKNISSGLVFKGDADINALLSTEMLNQLQTDVGADTLVYVGQKPTMTGDNDIGDGEICVLAIGPQAEVILSKFESVGDSTTLSTKQVNSMFLDLTVGDIGKMSQESATAGAAPELAEA